MTAVLAGTKSAAVDAISLTSGAKAALDGAKSAPWFAEVTGGSTCGTGSTGGAGGVPGSDCCSVLESGTGLLCSDDGASENGDDGVSDELSCDDGLPGSLLEFSPPGLLDSLPGAVEVLEESDALGVVDSLALDDDEELDDGVLQGFGLAEPGAAGSPTGIIPPLSAASCGSSETSQGSVEELGSGVGLADGDSATGA